MFSIFEGKEKLAALVLVATVINNIKTNNKWPLYGLGLIRTK